MKQYRPLIMRSNRFLGSALIERNLLSVETLEAANEKLLENIQAGDLRSANLLNILLFEMKAFEEQALIDQIVEESNIGLIDLHNYNMLKIGNEVALDHDLCWATYTVPFDKVEEFTFLATAYYLSKPAIKAWEDAMSGRLVWYTSSITSIFNALGRLEGQDEPVAVNTQPKGTAEEAAAEEKASEEAPAETPPEPPVNAAESSKRQTPLSEGEAPPPPPVL